MSKGANAPPTIYNNLYYLAGYETMEMTWTRCQELVSFYLAIFILVIYGSGASSQLMETLNTPSNGESNNYSPEYATAITNGTDNGTFDLVVRNWQGIATKADKSYPMRLNVEIIWTLEPDEARRFLASNISIEEVRIQTREGEGYAIPRGSIRLNNESYRLIDIALAQLDNKSTLEALVDRPRFGSGSEDAASIIGRVVLTMSRINGKDVADGYMVIYDTNYSGTYKLSLNEHPGRGPRARIGMMGHA
jgi:hypothetical protein